MISNPSAIHSTRLERGGRLGDAGASGAFSLNTISGSIFGEIIARERQRGLVRRRVAHRVVVHVRPDERLELEHAPHRLVGVADLAADGRAAVRAPHPHELALDRVGRRRDRSPSRADGGAARVLAARRTQPASSARERVRSSSHAGYRDLRRPLAFAVACGGAQPEGEPAATSAITALP